MSNYGIDFLTPKFVPGGQVTITAGGGADVILENDAAAQFSNSVFLKRIEALCVTAGSAGNLELTNSFEPSPFLLLPVGDSTPGDLRVWEFPVPPSGTSFELESPAGTGDWKIIAFGFIGP